MVIFGRNNLGKSTMLESMLRSTEVTYQRPNDEFDEVPYKDARKFTNSDAPGDGPDQDDEIEIENHPNIIYNQQDEDDGNDDEKWEKEAEEEEARFAMYVAKPVSSNLPSFVLPE